MEGCHVIIFISQNPNPNFLFSFHHHGSRRRTSSPRRRRSSNHLQPPSPTHLSSPESAPRPPRRCNRSATRRATTIFLHSWLSQNLALTTNCASTITATHHLLLPATRSCANSLVGKEMNNHLPEDAEPCTAVSASFHRTFTTPGNAEAMEASTYTNQADVNSLPLQIRNSSHRATVPSPSQLQQCRHARQSSHHVGAVAPSRRRKGQKP